MPDYAHYVPADEEPAPPPAFTTEGLEDSRGWLKWVPELVLGLDVDIRDAGRPHFARRFLAVCAAFRSVFTRIGQPETPTIAGEHFTIIFTMTTTPTDRFIYRPSIT